MRRAEARATPSFEPWGGGGACTVSARPIRMAAFSSARSACSAWICAVWMVIWAVTNGRRPGRRRSSCRSAGTAGPAAAPGRSRRPAGPLQGPVQRGHHAEQGLVEGVVPVRTSSERLHEDVDLLWRTSALRVQAMQPLDEVRTGTTAFDQTLFGVVPALYRSLDRALQGDDSGRVPPLAPPFLRYGSWIGADRDGNPFVTAQVTIHTAEIQAEHALRALENAATRIGRALTVHAPPPPQGSKLGVALAAARRIEPVLMAELTARSPQEPFREFGLLIAARLRATRLRATPSEPPPGRADLAAGGWPTAIPASCSPTCGCCSRPWPRRGQPPGVRRAAAPDLAGRELRLPPGRAGGPPAQRRARQGAARAALGRGPVGHDPRGAGHAGGHRRDPAAVRAAGLPPLRGQLHHLGRRHRRRLRAGPAGRAGRHRAAAAGRDPAVRERGGPGELDQDPGRHAGPGAGGAAAGRGPPGAGGHARLLRLGQGARPGQRQPAAVRRAAAAGPVGRRARHPADPVPRPRRRAGPRRRPGRPGRAGPGPRLGGRPVQGDRAGRGDLRPVRPSGHRAAPPGAGRPRPSCWPAPPTAPIRRRPRATRCPPSSALADRIDAAALAPTRP